ncbi:MAG: type II secretion system protein [Patescibacteria group bacterium]
MKGFTLIEMLITITVFSIITAVVGLSLFGFKRKQDLESEKVRITAALNEARQRATTNEGGKRFGVRITKNANNEFYDVVELLPGRSGGCYSDPDNAPPVTMVQRYQLRGSVDFIQPAGSGIWDIVFSPLSGIPDPLAGPVCHDNEVTISISGSLDPLDQRRIIVNDSGTIINQ